MHREVIVNKDSGLPADYLDIIEECARAGRRRAEIAAFLAREYGLDAGLIARLMAAHGARRAREAVSAALAGLCVAVSALLSRHAQADVPFIALI